MVSSGVEQIDGVEELKSEAPFFSQDCMVEVILSGIVEGVVMMMKNGENARSYQSEPTIPHARQALSSGVSASPWRAPGILIGPWGRTAGFRVVSGCLTRWRANSPDSKLLFLSIYIQHGMNHTPGTVRRLLTQRPHR